MSWLKGGTTKSGVEFADFKKLKTSSSFSRNFGLIYDLIFSISNSIADFPQCAIKTFPGDD